MKEKPIYTITTADNHKRKSTFKNSIDGTNLKIVPIDNTLYSPAESFYEYFSALRQDMFDRCAFPTTKAIDYVGK